MNTEPDDVLIETPPADTSIEDDVIAAMDKAIEENPANDLPVDPAPVDEVKAEPVADKPAEPKAEPSDTDKEIASLNLKDKAAARFHELTGEIKTLAPIKEALEKAGIKDMADVPRLIERAAYADEWDEQIYKTEATPEQMNLAFDYLRFANLALKGDTAAAEKCFNYMKEEMQTWAGMLGRDVAGVADPLAEHKDLQEAIDNGEITKAYALQIAGNRTVGKVTNNYTEQTQRATEQEQQFQSGTLSLNELGDVLQRADQHYQSKLQYFLPIVRTIRETCHPSEWAKRSQQAYLEIPDPVSAAPIAQKTPTPIRPAGLAPGLTPVFDDPMEAMNFGINLASQ